MNKFQEILLNFILQLISLLPIWLVLWAYIKRQRRLEMIVEKLADINNHEAYYAAKKTVERLQDAPKMTQDELKELDQAKRTIADHERVYKRIDPENN